MMQQTDWMKDKKSWYYGHRIPPEIISYAVWLYHRFCLSFRDVENLLAERGVQVSYESVRQWCNRFGPQYARTLKKRQGRRGDTWHLDEVFIKIRGKQHYLWRAVDQDGTCYAQFIIASSVHGLLLIGSRLRVSNKNASPISRA